MRVIVRKITNFNMVREANEITTGKKSRQKPLDAYKSEHSTIRTQIFSIDCYDVPTFVMGHYVRHNIGVEFFVRSQRTDRGGETTADRNTLTDFNMLANAQSLINIMRKRLCCKASTETRELAYKIREEILNVEYDLGKVLVPNCVYRGGMCPEPKSCGRNKHYIENQFAYYKELFV